jgi:hypothetical protein
MSSDPPRDRASTPRPPPNLRVVEGSADDLRAQFAAIADQAAALALECQRIERATRQKVANG